MSRSWLKTALIISLVFNVAVLGAVVYGMTLHARDGFDRQRSGEEVHGRHLKRCRCLAERMGMRPGKARQLEAVLGEHGEQMEALRRELDEQRGELLELIAEAEPDEPAVTRKVEEIAKLQGELEKLIIRRLLKAHEIFTPAEREKFLNMLRCRMAPECGGRPSSHGHVHQKRKEGRI
jgi:Spy/CpxP family protein refolding chaperone